MQYQNIEREIERIPDSPLHNLLWTLDFYIEKADLTPQQYFIIEKKKAGFSNREISQALQKELGIFHQENYICSIWTSALKKVVAAAQLNYDEWLAKDYEKAWKVCKYCGKKMLRDERNFSRKAVRLDGLSHKCKKCDKRTRTRPGVKKDNGEKTN